MPTSVANFDIAGAADRIVAISREVIASQSARQAKFNEHDRGRQRTRRSRNSRAPSASDDTR